MIEQPSDGRPDAILRMVERVAALDFSGRLWISDRADQLDAIASGLNMLSEELEGSLAERERVEEELRRQRHLLAHVQRVTTMGEVAGALAHEFSQPLTAVLSNAQAARRFMKHDAPDLDEVAKTIDDIIADARRSAEIMSRLRAMIQKRTIETAPMDLNAVVENVIALLRGEAELENVAVDLRLAESLPPVVGDPVQLQQVLVNLIKNGFDAMKVQAIEDRLMVIETAEDGDVGVRVSVRDTGVGVDEGAIESLFEPFHTTKDDGLGMGLAISRSIINEHRGEIWAERNPDRGMSFHFTLPRGEAA